MDVPNSGAVGPDFKSLVIGYTLMSHQLEPGIVFADPILSRILPFRDDPLSTTTAGDEDSQTLMKLQLALIHRYADDLVAAAVARDVSQLVVLDAGLSTIAHRRAYPATRIYEVDLAATQRWKRQSLAVAAVDVPATLKYLEVGPDHDLGGVDFERRGYDFDASTLVVWLDGMMFLPADALWQATAWLDRHRHRVELVASYLQTPATTSAATRAANQPILDLMARTADPIVTFCDPDEVDEALRSRGFDPVDDIGWAGLCARYVPAVAGQPDPLGVHVVHASRDSAPTG